MGGTDLAFVHALEILIHPAPVGPLADVEEMMAHVQRLADQEVERVPVLFHLWLRWRSEGNVRAEPLEWLLATLLERHPDRAGRALSSVMHRVSPFEAGLLREYFGAD
ncbi:hypothetical protein [Deinococcus hopiensis]|uniref:Uncharacterized protein n=1 Tax=Deinococcus hopiensis KR-140 TaxID=695939 RepID=A0A1W1UBB3_9DEIO|nr:hypothetical protein [Deinococcus hopiensis]SMB78330.1 hypothetical protein SAMN00790413_06605 [Deinococcus hopiensis KR-140]